MSPVVFLQDLAIVMAVSAVIMIFCQKTRLPIVFGYLVAGFILGPHSPPFAFISDIHSIHTLSQLGVIFLLFSIGLEFSFRKLLRVGLVAIFAASFEILLMIWIGFAAGRFFGWSLMDSLFLGAILSISSTTIIAKILLDMRTITEKFAQIILGILIVEDILAIVIIAILSGLAVSGELTLFHSGMAFLGVLGFVSGILLAGFLMIPRLLGYLERSGTSETLIITVLGLCFGAAYLAERFGFSVALGSFLMGAIIAETKQARSVIQKMEPIRDMFTAIFFVSVGLLIDPRLLAQFWPAIFLITGITILGKILSCSFATFLSGYPGDTALKVGLGLAQIGEFSFIIARLGENTQVTSDFLYPVAVSVSAVTTLTTPFLMRNTVPVIKLLDRMIPRPLATFLGFYTVWFQKIGGFTVREEKKKQIFHGLGEQMTRLMMYLAAGGGILWAAWHIKSRFAAIPDVFIWVGLGITQFPVLMGIVYSVDRILWNVLFLNLVRKREEIEEATDANRMLHNVLRIITVILVGLVLLQIGSIFMPSLPFTLAVGGLIFLSAFLFWGSLRRLHERVERLILGVFDFEQPLKKEQIRDAHDQLVKLIREEYPWEVITEDFLVPFHECGINRTLRELHLRSKTGATVVAVYRDPDSIANPPPDTKIQPGDVLLLMGDHKQIKRAVQFLQEKGRENLRHEGLAEATPHAQTRTFQIPVGSRLAGRRIRDLGLRKETGANILGIRKDDSTLTNPETDTILEEGTVLILFGTSGQLDRAVQFLQNNA